jgi:hypothetical protein
MKTLKYLIPTIACLLSVGLLNAQVAVDPIKKVYRIGGSSEIFISYMNNEKVAGDKVMDVTTAMDNINIISGFVTANDTGLLDRSQTDCAMGDFNADGADEVVTVVMNASMRISLMIPRIDTNLIINGPTYLELPLYQEQFKTMRIIAGNFDDDPQDEFAVCYDRFDGMFVRVFETDSTLSIKGLASFTEAGTNFYNTQFDIAAGDVDGDGIDEIIRVTETGLPEWTSSTDGNYFTSTIDLYQLKYVPNEPQLKHVAYKGITSKNITGGEYYPDQPKQINEMKIACGDLDVDGKDEIVVAWSFNYCFDKTSTNIFTNTFFLNLFKLNESGIGNFYNYRGQLQNSATIDIPDRHWALTLKCEPLDYMGRAVIMHNSRNSIWIDYWPGGLENAPSTVEVIMHGGYYHDIQGNETFTVADLNPDTAALNFRKELIILANKNSGNSQLSNRATVGYDGIAGMAIASITSETSEGITVYQSTTGPVLPFSAYSNFAVFSFLAGDFDIKDAEVYEVGTPDIITVKGLEQPIVILNSPPVHFDVLGGKIYDINNAYKGGSPTFFAKYSTTITNTNTTSIKVDKGMGISSEFKAFAFASGNGFELGVRGNFNMDKSFFDSKERDITVQQGFTIEKEDYIRYSELDYLYYDYPVYDKKKDSLVGDIAVLNPQSEDRSNTWKQGKLWNHPSFVFNHEPGNILSYKQQINWPDTSSIIDGIFTYAKYDTYQVTNSAIADFSFTSNRFKTSENSYSYKAGVGADLLLKAGYEGKQTVFLGALGIGGSTELDIKMGVSYNLSANYNQSQLTTHTIKLSDAFKIEGNIGNLDQTYGETGTYEVTPYIYRSQSGALVLDYFVHLYTDTGSWWVNNYGQNPDLAFIQPSRYATEKGSAGVLVSVKQKTSDIQFCPTIVNPGDTVVITARVHNFSLKNFNESIIKLDYYLDYPDDRGVKLTDIYNVTGSSKRCTNMSYPNTDREEILTFIWKVPTTVTCSPRIYAVIDPENEYMEIHKNNNVGWNRLRIYDCDTCSYEETLGENIIAEQLFFKAYPNPFNSACQISFSLLQAEDVQIDLYNLTGQKIANVAKGMYDSGEHKVSLSGENLGNGIYVCKIQAGTYREVIKLVVIR